MSHKIHHMLDILEVTNTKIHPEWRTQNFPWHRAIWLESAELLDHYGYKWWKQQTPNVSQIKLELVDIWVFNLSQMAEAMSPAAISHAVYVEAEHQQSRFVTPGQIRRGIETMAERALREKALHLPTFFTLLRSFDMSFDELYALYVAKQVLNRFRQDYGYQSGTYQKIWGGREDNEHLTEIAAQVDADRPDIEDAIYRELAARYPGAV